MAKPKPSKHHVAGHVGREHVAEAEVAGRVDQSVGEAYSASSPAATAQSRTGDGFGERFIFVGIALNSTAELGNPRGHVQDARFQACGVSWALPKLARGQGGNAEMADPIQSGVNRDGSYMNITAPERVFP